MFALGFTSFVSSLPQFGGGFGVGGVGGGGFGGGDLGGGHGGGHGGGLGGGHGGGHGGYGHEPTYADAHPKYDYGYGVKDDYQVNSYKLFACEFLTNLKFEI